jgi:U3 small nucleolar RNA-associated protein 25
MWSLHWPIDIEHKARFFDDFGVEDDEDEEANNDGNEGQEDGIGYKGGKPADFKALFSGNNDDHFRIGIKFTRWVLSFF